MLMLLGKAVSNSRIRLSVFQVKLKRCWEMGNLVRLSLPLTGNLGIYEVGDRNRRCSFQYRRNFCGNSGGTFHISLAY